MPTPTIAEINRLDATQKFTAESVSGELIQLPNGGTVVTQKLTGRDFFEFQRAIVKNSDAVEGMQQLMLKMFKWVDGSPLQIDQLLDEDGIGFAGCSLLSEKMTALFNVAPGGEKSLTPAK